MEEQELLHIWKNSSKTEGININCKKLMDDFKCKMENRERIVRRRDRREIIASIIGVIGFGYTFYIYPNTISRIGSVIGLLSLIYIVYKLRSNRKSKFVRALFLPIQKQLTHQKQFMLNQYNLLDTVIYWLSTPIFLANTLLVFGISKSEQSFSLLDQLTYKWQLKLLITIVLAIGFGYIGWMNKKAAKVNWKPLIKEIDSILNNLKDKK